MLCSNGIYVFFSWDNFTIDFDSLMDQALKYLIDLGHTRIAYLSRLSINDSLNIRYHSFTKALELNNLPYDNELIIDGIYPFLRMPKVAIGLQRHSSKRRRISLQLSRSMTFCPQAQ